MSDDYCLNKQVELRFKRLELNERKKYLLHKKMLGRNIWMIKNSGCEF